MADSLPQTVCPECLLKSCKIYQFREMAFKSNILLRQKILKQVQSNKQPSPAKKQINSINKSQQHILVEEEADVIATNDDSEMVEYSNMADEADNDIEYVTVILENDESMEGSEAKIEVFDEPSEMEALHENEQYIVAEESTHDTIPKMSLNRQRRRRRSKNDSNRSLTCPECGKVLSNASSFKYHMQLHSEDTPYLCSDCGEGFKTRNAYDGHLVTHMESNPNKCNICGKSYRQAASLRSHLLVHSGEKVIKYVIYFFFT